MAKFSSQGQVLSLKAKDCYAKFGSCVNIKKCYKHEMICLLVQFVTVSVQCLYDYKYKKLNKTWICRVRHN